MKLNIDRSGRTAVLAAVLVGLTLQVSCGGSGTLVQQFVPTRLIALGDESSVINPGGSKYTVNAVVFDNTTTPPTPTTALDCVNNPIWIQALAARYGMVFPECNPAAVPAPAGRIYAVNGAKVADIEAQINRVIANGGFTDTDMVTVYVGANNIIEQFELYQAGTLTVDQANENLKVAGLALAAQVSRIALLGPRVVFSTTPDMGRTPYAGPRFTSVPNTKSSTLTTMSQSFNNALLGTVLNDGHKIGLVQLGGFLVTIDNLVTSGGTTSYVNTTLPACKLTAPLPTCTTQTLFDNSTDVPPPAVVVTANGTTWLWADSLHMSAGAQASFGSLAVTRVDTNPF